MAMPLTGIRTRAASRDLPHFSARLWSTTNFFDDSHLVFGCCAYAHTITSLPAKRFKLRERRRRWYNFSAGLPM